MELKNIKINPDNPRLIIDDKFNKLCESIKSFPKMLELRPIIVDETGLILGGNMRFRALQKLGIELKDSYFKEAKELTDEEKKRFIVEDNIGFGAWDYDILSSNYETQELLEWGLTEKDLQLNDFNPNLMPNFGGDDTTKEEIEKKAKELAQEMMKEQRKLEIICPKCSYEFTVENQ